MTAVGDVASSWIPPPLPECEDAPGCVLLDLRCYVADLPNATTATGVTSDGLPIQVTFCAARPPTLSHLYVHCPGRDFPALVPPKVITAHADLLLLRVPIYPDILSCVKAQFWDYFVYRAHPARLDLIPNPYPKSFKDPEAALVSLNDGGYVVASLRHKFPRRVPSGAYITEFDLHLYRSSSPDDGWVTTRLSVENTVRDPLPRAVADLLPYHETGKTVTVGSERGTVAWVDLWFGVILCDLLDDCLVLRDVPLPAPARANWDHLVRDDSPNYVRDVTVSRRRKDSIECVEMERCPPKEPEKTTTTTRETTYHDWVHRNRRSPLVRGDGWKVTTWSKPIIPAASSEDWRLEHEVHVNDLTVDASKPWLFKPLSNMQEGRCDIKAILRRLPVAYPTISMDGDAVYLLSNVNKSEVLVAVDVKKKTLRGVAELDTRKDYYLMPSYCFTEISSYLK